MGLVLPEEVDAAPPNGFTTAATVILFAGLGAGTGGGSGLGLVLPEEEAEATGSNAWRFGLGAGTGGGVPEVDGTATASDVRLSKLCCTRWVRMCDWCLLSA